MKVNVLVADDDMVAMQLMYDVLDIVFRDVKIERAMTSQSFWAKFPAADDENPWQLIFLAVDYIKEAPSDFLERFREANQAALGKVIVTGSQAVFDECAEEIKRLPFLAKPFSLDGFEEIVKAVAS
jgi:two-component SAPR family response regulator